MKYQQYFPFLIVILMVISFFLPAFFQGKMLLPSDTIVGLYHPYRDLYASEYPNGVPFKNSLITDPVRQQYPWKNLAIAGEKIFQTPIWNPYTFAGTPLLANFQSAVFYPLNLLFFLLPFSSAWNLFILLQCILGAMFMYLYLKNFRLQTSAAILGSFVFVYSGFSVVWLEWGNIVHTVLWLPLILLAIDKIVAGIVHRAESKVVTKTQILWSAVFIFALVSSFFAGHLQTFFYLFLISITYVMIRWSQNSKKLFSLLLFAICYLLFSIITAIQWYPTLQYILVSARSVDQLDWKISGWFIPWQHSIQFLAPDFFGNPATLNYFGVWNYAEFMGYVGILPLILAFYAISARHDKKTFFYAGIVVVSLLFAFPTVAAKLPFTLSVPFISTSQPTRLLGLTDFALSILAALGLDHLIRIKKMNFLPLLVLGCLFGLLWGAVLFYPNLVSELTTNVLVAKRNLQFPTLLFLLAAVLLIAYGQQRLQKFRSVFIICMVVLVMADLVRFTTKFLPLTNQAYLYPQTKTTLFLQQHSNNARYMSLDSRILPPNFSQQYGLQTIEGYDPLYLLRYGELLTASERGRADISPPFGFNRILTPHEPASKIMNLLGVKYVLSLTDVSYPGLMKVFQEGETRIYENSQVLPRAFLVSEVTVLGGENKQRAIEFLFSTPDLRTTAVVEDHLAKTSYASGSASIVTYTPNKVSIVTTTTAEGFLVLTDAYYSGWKATIRQRNSPISAEVPIYRTDFHFRGVVVPAGTNTVEFTNTLF